MVRFFTEGILAWGFRSKNCTTEDTESKEIRISERRKTCPFVQLGPGNSAEDGETSGHTLSYYLVREKV